MIIEGHPDEADFGPEHYDIDPADCPNLMKNWSRRTNPSMASGWFQ